jgi:O-methyltransferase
MTLDAPAQNYRLLRKFIPGSLQPFLRGIRKRVFNSRRPNEEPFRTVYPYTQAHPVRQQNLLRLAKEIDERSVPGAIVECGVLDGGTAAIMAFGTAKSGRDIHLFDSWAGLPDISEEDGDAKSFVGDVVGSQRRVVSVLRALKINLGRVTFHKGWFDKTFPKASIGKIALLHVDADFYNSVKLTLETWVPHMSEGGYIQIDDYLIFTGCTKAIDEYLAEHPDLRLEIYQEQAFFIKIPS